MIVSPGTDRKRGSRKPATTDAMRDRAFHDLWMTAQGPALCQPVADATAALADLDAEARADRQRAGQPTRRPHAAELERRKAMIGNIFANLLWLHHDKQGRYRLIVDLSRRGVGRYRPSIFRQLKPILTDLETAGFIIWHATDRYGQRSTISAAARLSAALDRHGATPADIGRMDDEETIILAPRPKRDDTSKPARKPPIDYRDTPQSKRYRREMQMINRCLAKADIKLLKADGSGPDPQPAWRLTRRFSTAAPDALPQPFDLHGRLYPRPDWWLSGLERDQRHRLRINGEPPAYLDFSNMHARLAYAEAGIAPPPGDLYRVPGFEDHREGVKKAFAAMLAKRSTRRQFSADTMALFPTGATAAVIVDAIMAQHPGIAHLLGTDRSIRYMFLDSTIMVAVLLRLAGLCIPALPLHDGLLAPRSAADAAKAVMEHEGGRAVGEAFGVAGAVGAVLPVDEKNIGATHQRADGH